MELRERVGLLVPLAWATLIAECITDAELSTPERLAAFVAQCGHESQDLTRLEENLRYGVARLRAVFPRYFPTLSEAAVYAGRPERIANRVYASRMGNGPEASGDGWRFKGRGLLQLTGRSAYAACSLALFHDGRLLQEPSWVAEPKGAARSAAWFWLSRACNALVDRGDLNGLTRRINGGLLGQADRVERYQKALVVLSA